MESFYTNFDNINDHFNELRDQFTPSEKDAIRKS